MNCSGGSTQRVRCPDLSQNTGQCNLRSDHRRVPQRECEQTSRSKSFHWWVKKHDHEMTHQPPFIPGTDDTDYYPVKVTLYPNEASDVISVCPLSPWVSPSSWVRASCQGSWVGLLTRTSSTSVSWWTGWGSLSRTARRGPPPSPTWTSRARSGTRHKSGDE